MIIIIMSHWQNLTCLRNISKTIRKNSHTMITRKLNDNYIIILLTESDESFEVVAKTFTLFNNIK